MKRDELVKALRFCEEHWNAAASVTGLETFGMAADMLENDTTHVASLQAENAALRSQVEQLTQGAVQEMKAFQMTVNQITSEKNALKEDLKRALLHEDECTFCAHCCENGKPLYRPNEPYLAFCQDCGDDLKNFEYRGPMLATAPHQKLPLEWAGHIQARFERRS